MTPRKPSFGDFHGDQARKGSGAPRPVHKHGQVHIVRPFLAISREEIRSGLAGVKMTWREDSTNQSSSYLRNRIRMNGLRLLKQDVDRDLLGGMSRSRDLLEEQEDAMNEWTVLAQDKCLKEGKLDTIELKTVPVAIRRRIIYNWISAEINPNALSNQMEQILKSVASDEKLDLSISPDRKVMLSENRLLVKVMKPDSGRVESLCICSKSSLVSAGREIHSVFHEDDDHPP